MGLLIITFFVFAVVMACMAVGVIFGRSAIKGSCGGAGGGACVCTEKCEKRKSIEMEGSR